MKPLISLSILLIVAPGVALADQIGVFVDPAGTVCRLATPLPAPANNAFYIVHRFNTGATASQFKVVDATGLFPASQSTPYLLLGTWNVDLSLAYGGCVLGDHMLMTLNFFWFGGALPTGCTENLYLAAAPTSPIPGEIAIVDCAQPSGNIKPATSRAGVVYSSDANSCGACPHAPVAESTWGGVKALYR